MAMSNSFEASLAKAERVEIHWCPVIKFSNFSKKDLAIWKESVCNTALVLKGSVAVLGVPALHQRGTLIEAALQLCSASYTPEIEEQLQDVLREGALSGWYSPSAVSNSSKNVSNTDVDDRVAMLDRSLEFELKSPLHACHQFLHRSDAGVFTCSFGIYEIDSDKESIPWTPEINITGLYPAARLRMEGHVSQLVEYFNHFCEKMFQKSIFVLLIMQDGSYEAWLHEFNHHFKLGKTLQLPDTHEWRLEATQAKQWFEQFSLFQRMLVTAWEDEAGRARIRSEMQKMRELTDNDDPFVGATFAPISREGRQASLIVSGRARFLFEASFPSNLRDREALEFADDELILLHSEANREDKTPSTLVQYASFAPDPGVNVRCLCGWGYPGENRHKCDPDLLKVVCHRSQGAAWITAAVNSHRGSAWDWRHLSSPHFYFAKNPAHLQTDAKRRRRMKADQEAREAAEVEWGRLFETILCYGK
jgi:hypothetical protein